MSTINEPDQWYKGINDISAEDPNGTLMSSWIVGRAAIVADTLPDDMVGVVAEIKLLA